MTSLLVSLTIRADYSTAVLRYISPNLYAPEGATCFEDKGVRPGLQNMERLSAIWQPLLSGVEPGGSVGFGAAGGQEVAGTLGFVAEEVDAEGELGAGFDALLVGVGVAGCGGDEAIVQADDGDVDEIQRGGVGVEQGADDIAADEVVLDDFEVAADEDGTRIGIAGDEVVDGSIGERGVLEEDAAEGDAAGWDESGNDVAAGTGTEDAAGGVAGGRRDFQVVDGTVGVVANDDGDDAEVAGLALGDDDKTGIAGGEVVGGNVAAGDIGGGVDFGCGRGQGRWGGRGRYDSFDETSHFDFGLDQTGDFNFHQTGDFDLAGLEVG